MWQRFPLTSPDHLPLIVCVFQIVDQINNKLPSSFVETILEPNSQLLELRFNRDREVCLCVDIQTGVFVS